MLKKFKYIKLVEVKKVIGNNIKILPILILPFIQWCVLAYIFSLGPQIIYGVEFSIKLYFFSFIIALISSLPISIAGFGLRELACVMLFDTFGLTQTEALTLSLIVGIGSIGSIAFLFFLKQYWVRFLQKIQSNNKNQIENGIIHNILIDNLLFKGLILLASVLICFQFHFSSGLYTINVNLADPVAAVGFVYCVLHLIQKQWNELQGFPLFWFASITTALGIGILTAFFKTDISNFGAINKGLGFLILTGYSYLGFFSIKKLSNSILSTIAELQVISLIIISLWKFVVMIGVSYDILPKILLLHSEFEGFSQDRNAFGFILTILILALHHVNIFDNFSTTKRDQVAGFLTYVVYLTHSKTAIISLSILYIFMILTHRLSFKKIITYGAFSLGFHAITVIACSGLSCMKFMQLEFIKAPTYGILQDFTSESSMHERMNSIYTGLTLFIKNPIFGAGLGNFKELWIRMHGHALIIHNSFVWILAEMGLIGFCLIFTTPIKWGWHIIKGVERLNKIKTETTFFLGLSLLFILFSIPQDVFYQRILWFWLGINFALQPHIFDQSKTVISCLNRIKSFKIR